MAKQRGVGHRTNPDAGKTYVEKKTPTGKSYWMDPNDPTKGYLVDPSKNPGAVAYPIEYINWLYRSNAPTARSVNRAASGREGRELSGQALGGKIGVVYGQTRIGSSVFFGPRSVLTNTNKIAVGYGLSQGPCDSLVSITFPNGKSDAQIGAFYFAHEFFTGELAPAGPSSVLMSAVAGADSATFERYPGLCYVAAALTFGEAAWAGISGIPMPFFVLKGRKVRNYSTGLDVWTDNPAYCLADYIVSKRFGRGAAVNVQSVIDAAAYCDETFTNTATGLPEKKHRLNYYLGRAANHAAHMDMLRAHFRCSVIERGGEFIFLIDKDKSPVMTFDETTAVPVTVERIAGSSIPNAVRVAHPDPNKNYETNEQWARTSGVEAGTVAQKTAEYELEGCTVAALAASEAYYLLNTRLNNLRVVLKAVHPKATRLEPSDVIEYTSASFGMTSFLLRVIKVTRAADGTSWMIECVGHDPAVYGFQSRPVETYPLPSLPSAYAAPSTAPSALSATEQTYQRQSGTYGSRISLTWTASTDPYAGDTVIRYRRNGGSWATLGEFPGAGPVYIETTDDLATYDFEAYTYNRYNRAATSASANLLGFASVGYVTPPPNVAAIYPSLREGQASFSWQPVTGKDIDGYELRMGSQTDTFDTAPHVVFKGQGTNVTFRPPYATWKFFLKAYNASGKYSVTSADIVLQVERAGPTITESTKALDFGGIVNPDDSDVLRVGTYLIIEGVKTQVKYTVMLDNSKTGDQLDAEMIAAGYAHVDAWEAAVPEAAYAGWGPLPDGGAVGELTNSGSATFGTAFRNQRVKIRMDMATRIGENDPSVLAKVEPYIFVGGAESKRFGPTAEFGKSGWPNRFGMRLSTNNKHAQDIIVTTALAPLYYYTAENIPVALETVTLTTDSSGLGNRTLSTPLGSTEEPDISFAPLNATTPVFVTLTAVSNTAFSIKVVDANGAAVTNCAVRCEVEDKGRGGTFGISSG